MVEQAIGAASEIRPEMKNFRFPIFNFQLNRRKRWTSSRKHRGSGDEASFLLLNCQLKIGNRKSKLAGKYLCRRACHIDVIVTLSPFDLQVAAG